MKLASFTVTIETDADSDADLNEQSIVITEAHIDWTLEQAVRSVLHDTSLHDALAADKIRVSVEER